MTDLSPGRINIHGDHREIRADHVHRYQWAASLLRGHVIDAGCHCGYGAAILADGGLSVTALDRWDSGLAFARSNYDRPGITWYWQDLGTEGMWLPPADAVVAFEIIEHMEEPARLLRAARRCADTLLASVPNEAVWPWSKRLGPEHKRHYTRAEFGALLEGSGWRVSRWWGQRDHQSKVEPDVNGRTLVAECR